MALPASLTLPSVQDLVIVVGCLSLAYYLFQRPRRPLPPSYRGWPILGNALDMPQQNPGQEYYRWGKELGSGIVSANALGQTVIILNSVDIAIELLESRSSIYSSRAKSTMACDLLGWEYMFVLLPYAERWRKRRRMFVQHFKPSDLSVVHPRAKEFAGRLLVEINRTPEQLIDLVRGAVGGLIISLAYGFAVKPRHDPFIEFAEYTMQVLSSVSAPGAFLVDVFPALRYVPRWFPGAGFKRKVEELWYMHERFRSAPFDEAVSQMESGRAQQSFVSLALNSLDENDPKAEEERQVVKDSAAMFYFAGIDTVTGSLLVWFWLMMKHPDVLRRVHAELDSVLGGRMPDWGDETRTPYLTATIMEAVRWKTVAPIGVPHVSTEDDVYGDYFFPKGTIVISNLWGMLHDERDYEDADTFNPDRFFEDGKLRADIRDPFTILFGFGRRVCPGAHIARALLWMNAAYLATVYSWYEPLAENGIELNLPEPFGPGFAVEVSPFPCRFEIRSEAARVHLTSLEASE